MKFKLSIELGNDAMQTGRDVSESLREAALNIERQMEMVPNGDVVKAKSEGVIYDLNGNRVGDWRFMRSR